ncbi:MAG: class I adenylate cyclase [Pseudomonadales bacterium]
METSAGPLQETEIDRAGLADLVARFRLHQAERVRRTGARLPGRQRRVLEALPMLYHRNHPALPGYVGPHVPSGIARYQPDHAAHQALRRVARSYQEPHPLPTATDLQAMFIMGSGGSVGQSRSSDIDLWVCCDTLLHSSLWPKVRMIDQWAADFGLQLHTFLVDPDVLRLRGRLPGTRTPALVLDEFYRSGALMAGRYPLWWLIPSDDPDRYRVMARRLMRRRFVAPDAVVDFGPVPAFPTEELAQAAIIELDRALKTPHKSLLKLQLVEAYAEAPEFGTVSSTYKALIHAGETNRLRLDPYLLLYDHLQRHLQARGRADEVPFVRGLLIGKSAENARVPHLQSAAGADQNALLQTFLGWGFSGDDVARFRSLDDWSMSARIEEHRRIMSALERGLQLVERLVADAGARGHTADPGIGPDDGQQLHWLNQTRLRHLQFAVNRLRPGSSHSLPLLHPALISSRRQVALKLNRSLDGWVARDDDGPVLRRRRLVDLVVWAELNGAYLIPLRADPELTRNVAQILQGFRGPLRDSYVFVNAEANVGDGLNPELRTAENAAERADLFSLYADPLDYVGFRHLDLDSFDIVSRNADGHWEVETLEDDASLLDRIGRLLASPPRAVAWQVVGGRARFVIAHRLEQLHALASRILDGSGAVFVLPFGDDTVTVLRGASGVEVRRHRSLAALRDYMRRQNCASIGYDPSNLRLRALLRAS